HALWAPKRTSKDVIGKLDAAAVHTMADPAVRQRLDQHQRWKALARLATGKEAHADIAASYRGDATTIGRLRDHPFLRFRPAGREAFRDEFESTSRSPYLSTPYVIHNDVGHA